jgi:hypothetical protein
LVRHDYSRAVPRARTTLRTEDFRSLTNRHLLNHRVPSVRSQQILFKRGKNVSNHSWRDLYRAALLEVNPARLRKAVEEATEAIQRKLHESADGEISAEELQALQDALQNLRVLQREYS